MDKVNLLGIDLAWNQDNPSALAFGELIGSKLKLTKVCYKSVKFSDLAREISAIEDLRGVAIDAPLIIKNAQGQRKCENEISKNYGKYHAGCYSMNIKNKNAANLNELGRNLENSGFKHLNQEGKFQIEVYPHPAMVEVFDLEQIIKYKKGKVESKKQGQICLAEKLKTLGTESNNVCYDLSSAENFLHRDYISQLKGEGIKVNEDILDSIFCLYTAALYLSDCCPKIFGDTDHGYIYVPQVSAFLGFSGSL